MSFWKLNKHLPSIRTEEYLLKDLELSVWNITIRRQHPYLLVPRGGKEELNFCAHLAPCCQTTSNPKAMRNAFLFGQKLISSLPSDFKMNYMWQMVSNPLIWGLVACLEDTSLQSLSGLSRVSHFSLLPIQCLKCFLPVLPLCMCFLSWKENLFLIFLKHPTNPFLTIF